jgi:hypothetical protein
MFASCARSWACSSVTSLVAGVSLATFPETTTGAVGGGEGEGEGEGTADVGGVNVYEKFDQSGARALVGGGVA